MNGYNEFSHNFQYTELILRKKEGYYNFYFFYEFQHQYVYRVVRYLAGLVDYDCLS